MMGYLAKPVKLLLYFLLLYFAVFNNVYAIAYEVAVKAYDSSGDPVSVNVQVYTYNSTLKNFEELRSANTWVDYSSPSGFAGEQGKEYNGAFDIQLDGMYEKAIRLFDPLPAADIYYVRIGNKYFRLEYNPRYEYPQALAYGDMRFGYCNGNVSLLDKASTCAYYVDGPHDWVDNTIKLSNNFGSDYLSCSGDITFDS